MISPWKIEIYSVLLKVRIRYLMLMTEQSKDDMREIRAKERISASKDVQRWNKEIILIIILINIIN